MSGVMFDKILGRIREGGDEGGGGGGGNTPKMYEVDDILHIPAEMLENCKVGDIFTDKTGMSSPTYNGIYEVELKKEGLVMFFYHKWYDYNEPSFGWLIYTKNGPNNSWVSSYTNLLLSNLLPLRPINVQPSIPNNGMESNTLYNLGQLTGNITFTISTNINPDIANVWTWTFETGATAPMITWPQQITMWADGEAPTIEANKRYEVSVMDGLACVVSADIPQQQSN